MSTQPEQAAGHDEVQCWTSQYLDRAERSLYYEARRYCLISEEGFVQNARSLHPGCNPEFVSIGDSATDLVDAANAYAEASEQWQQAHPEPPHPDAVPGDPDA